MKKYQVTIHVFRKVGCNNPEEPTTLAALTRLDLGVITSIRMGKCFLLGVTAENEAAASLVAEKACRKLLANLVMEHFEIAGIKETAETVK